MILPPVISIPPEDEIVEDSEPEREERRQQRRAQRQRQIRTKPRRTPSVVVVVSSESDSPPRRPYPVHDSEVIEISDSSESSDVERVEAYLRDEGDSDDVGVDEERDPINLTLSGEVSGATAGAEISETSFPSIRDILGKQRASPTNAAPSSAKPAVPPARSATLVQSESVSEPHPLQRTGSKPLNIAQYAYSRASSVTTARSIPQPQPRNVVPSRENSVKPARESLDLLEIFTTVDLLRIRKCVSCSQSWTTRKTSAQKVKHIKTCAKKKKLTNETVCVLMRQEIEASPALELVVKPPPWISDSNLPPLPTQPEPTTLLEAAVKEDASKKRSRRRRVTDNVKELAETRPSILDRARQLLAEPAPQVHLVEADQLAPPLTQPFGESHLANRFRRKPVPEAEPTQVYAPTPMPVAGPSRAFPASPQEPEDTSLSIHPPTQPFGESALAQKFASHARSFDMDDDISDAHPGRSVFDERSNSSPQRESFFHSQHAGPSVDPVFDPDLELMDDPMFMYNSTSLRAQTTPSPLKHYSANDLGPWLPSTNMSPPSPGLAFPRKSPPPSPPALRDLSDHISWRDMYDLPDDHILSNWNIALDDDAFLHYEPDLRASPVVESDSMPAGSVAAPDFPPPDTNTAQDASSPKKKPARKPSDTKGKASEETTLLKSKDVTDQELHDKLRKSILEDAQLHSRILRYEPVEFDTFFQLALDMGIKSSGPLKTRVIRFLDQQAIHFYDLSKERTRRR